LDNDASSLVLEYELPFEGGRRPDVVLLLGGAIVVLEFKGSPAVEQAHLDQVSAYRRDILEYHEASRDLPVHAVLVMSSDDSVDELAGDVQIVGRDSLAACLSELACPGSIDLDAWLRAPYAPLPSLVEAARRIFQHDPLPHVRRAIAARVPETVGLISALASEARDEQRRRLIFLTGVPGAGKTLVGLRVVYEHHTDEASSTFLSGNGPLVTVLRDALRSGVFVRDLHKFITSYGTTDRVPAQHVVVFDEAQRAWDREYMQTKRGIARSEPELLISIGERIPNWSTLVGLVGSGQEIHSGEEAGLSQWRDAVLAASEEWELFCPPGVATEFSDLNVTTHDDLSLDVSLRSRRAETLHLWVQNLLDGALPEAEKLSDQIREDDFTLYVTRDLDAARDYLQERYSGEDDARYGLVASSHATNLQERDVDNSWIATSRMNIAKWFNADREDPKACCALVQPVTEFGCQGLELDMPVVCWGNDLRWEGNGWVPRPRRRRYALDDPVRVLLNCYRVLLTRGRDGAIIWVPLDPDMDETQAALIDAGAAPGW
jgi:DUF2075 family protein